MRIPLAASVVVGATLLAGCADNARLPATAGIGEAPALPVPTESAIPIIDVSPARGWAETEAPTPAPGFEVTAFARGLDHPRWLLVLPDGDVLVAESNAQPSRPKSLRDVVMKLTQGIAGAEAPSPDRILLLRDADGDGVAETRTIFLSGLTSPFGMALVGGDLYVADTDALLRFLYHNGDAQISERGTKVAALPAGEINHHWTKGLVARPDGRELFVSVGSNSDHGENGIDAEVGRAAIWEITPATGATRLFAAGLRNPVGMDFEPWTGTLWTVVNERDELGGDLVPDYLTSVHDGSFYGWPYSYYGDHLDPRVQPQRPDLVASARVPDFALGPHGAPLGLTFADGAKLGPRFADGAFVGQHGSWNRKPQYGYRVIFVPFHRGRPAAPPVEVLTGFLDDAGNARGRPVGVVVDNGGALLVADDVGNAIWRVTAE
jgi:glucose/arabinose dehydrogenase